MDLAMYSYFVGACRGRKNSTTRNPNGVKSDEKEKNSDKIYIIPTKRHKTLKQIQISPATVQ